MTEVQLWEALSLLMAAIQMGCIAFLAAAIPMVAIQALHDE